MKSSISVEGNYKTSVLRSESNLILKNKITKLPNINRVLNIGAIQSDIDKEGRFYKDYFPNQCYFTLDYNRDLTSDRHFNLDVYKISKIRMKFDLILVMSVLEHIYNPFDAVKEIIKKLNRGGYIFVVTPFFYPIHKDSSGKFSDLWRFTDDGLRALFHKLKEEWIKPMPSVIVSVRDRASYWDNHKTTSGYCALFRKNKWF